MVRERIGTLLLNAKLITEKQLAEAVNQQRQRGGRLGSILVKNGFLSKDALLRFLSQQYGVASVDPAGYELDARLAGILPLDLAKKYVLVPLRRVGTRLTIAMADPSNVVAIDEIKVRTGFHVVPLVAMEAAILQRIRQLYSSARMVAKAEDDEREAAGGAIREDEGRPQSAAESEPAGVTEGGTTIGLNELEAVLGDALSSITVVEQTAEDEEGRTQVQAPIVRLVNGMLVNAVKAGASDIHLEPYEEFVRVRFRLDGVLHTVMNLPLKIRNATISRLKIISKLDIAERRLPQDGRIRLRIDKKWEVDFRVSVLPTLYGEKVVLRILDKASLVLDLEKLGFEERPLVDFQNALELPYGMLLVTGPTGSGKTTTLYSALQLLNTPDVNIMTAEDPVEYNFVGINQVQIKEEIGLTFAAALRSFLRQDPDIVMVGEIRDQETAEIAVKAALTGHLVLSTLHTNDAPSTVTRLVDMGVERFLVASSVVLVMAQRLVRRICRNCQEPVKLPVEKLILLGFTRGEAESIVPMRGRGCSACHQTGYRGRVALYEVLPIGEELRDLILRGASADEIRKRAFGWGFKTVRMAGLTKIKEGITTVDEVAGGVTAG